jgi:hypothetical protein
MWRDTKSDESNITGIAKLSQHQEFLAEERRKKAEKKKEREREEAEWEKNRDTLQGVASVVPPKPLQTKERDIDWKKQPTYSDRRDPSFQQDLKPHNQPIFGDTDSRGALIEPRYREPKFSYYRGGGKKTRGKKTKCIKQTTKKYKTRPGPAFPANMCKGKKKLGNDKKYYLSKKNKKGVYTWKKMSKTKQKKI